MRYSCALMHSAKHHSRRVLVIDDDLDGMQTLATLLRHMGHEVEFAINGSAGLEAAQRMEPEFVLLDLNLPGMDGFEVARRLKGARAAPRPRIIAITGYSGEDYRRRSLAAGCEQHLVKPVDSETLLRLLE
jgi:CheY-like chemotaxis protein